MPVDGVTSICYGNPMKDSRLPAAPAVAATIFLLFATNAAQAQVALRVSSPERIRVVERSNLTRRDDNRYVGLLTREVTGHLTRTDSDDEDGSLYEGLFFRFEQLRRDMEALARPVDESVEAEIVLTDRSLFVNAPPYPRYYGVPYLPTGPVAVNDTWEAWAAVRLQPEPEIAPLILPVVVQYRYAGTEEWNGSIAQRIDAQFATRYPLPPSDDPEAPVVSYSGRIASVTGSHRLTVLIPVEEGQTLFIRDEVHELYRYTDGSDSTYRGHVLLFLSGLRSESRRRIAQSVDEELASQEVEGVTVEETDAGVRLTLQALQFLPDQAVLIPEERPRLDSIAAALSRVENARFLVVGHTADVGSMESQQRLSEERARTIASELVARGVDQNRLDLEGRAGRDPVASNASETGREQNRRVEIYVLEQ